MGLVDKYKAIRLQ